MFDKTNEGLVAYAKSQVGKPYWYGAFGNTSSADLLEQLSSRYPSIYTTKRIIKAIRELNLRVHDDVGLIKGYLWSKTPTSGPIYSTKENLNAAQFYSRSDNKGKIINVPHIEGILIFKGPSEASINHVGIYDGEKYVYEAKGFDYGVVKTPFKYNEWNYFAYCPFITYNTEAKEEPLKELEDKNTYKIKFKPGTWNIRKSPTLSSIIVKIVDNEAVFKSSKKISGWYYIDELRGYINAICVNDISGSKDNAKIYRIKMKPGKWIVKNLPTNSGKNINIVDGDRNIISAKKENNDWYYINEFNGYINSNAFIEIK